MNWRTTIALILLACGLAAVLLFTRERIEDPKAPTVAVFGGRSLREAIRIRWRHGPTSPLVELIREGEGPFRLTEPIVDQCSAAFLRNLVASYDAEPLREAFPGEKLTAEQIAALGLDEPRTTLEAWFEDGKQVKIEIGGQGPLGRDNYVRRDGVIYSGGLGLWSALQVNVNDLRERRVFNNSRATATSLTVDQVGADGKAERVRLVYRDGWYMEEPRQSRTESAASESFVALVLGLSIDHFPVGQVVKPPDRPADYTITVDGSLGSETVKLWRDPSDQLIGDHPGRKIYFVSSGSQYTEIFVNVAERMRARWLIPIQDLPENLTRVVIDQGGDRPRIVLSRQNKDAPFQLHEPVVSPCAPTPLAKLIQALNNLRVVDYVDGRPDEARFGLVGEGLTVEVFEQGKPKGTVLKIGADAAEERSGIKVTYVQRRDEPGNVVAVPKAAVDLLREPWNVYPELKVMTLLPGTVVERVLVRGRDAPDVEYRRKEGRWQRVGTDAPADWVGSVMDEIADLRGISADTSRRLRLGDPDRTIELCRANNDEFASLLVWDRGKGQQLRVRLKSKDALVFELDDLRSDYLRKLWQ